MSFLCGLLRDLRVFTDFIDPDELFVSSRLKAKLSTSEYRVLDNVLLPSKGNTPTTQIDHLVISVYGIFVIETKSHQGWIFGSVRNRDWTQSLNPKTRYRIYNPFWQNHAHTSAIESLLRSNLKSKPVSLVAFPSASKVLVKDAENVGTTQYIIDRILSFNTKIYSATEVIELIELISMHNLKSSAAHIQHVKDVKAYLQAA